MASGNRTVRRQTYRQNPSNVRQMYVYGNTVTKPAYEPKRQAPETQHPQRTSRQVRKNRRQAMHVSKAYVVFMTAAAVLMLVVCVNYVQLRSEITSRSKNISAMQTELAQMREENNTKYNVIMDSVNLDEIRTKAMNELGMVYANKDQIVEYDNPAGDYVKQYENIPEDGVLASSKKVQE